MAARALDPMQEARRIVGILRHHWALIAGIALLIVFAVGVRTLLETPIYRATATVLIDPELPKVVNIQEVTPMGGSGDYYQTQYAIIQSRPVAEKVVEGHRLKERYPALANPDVLRAHLSVESKRGTRLVMVHFDHPDPRVAAEMANAVAAGYVRYNLDLKLRGAHEAATWLSDEIGTLKAKVEQSAMALQNYRVKSGILGLQEQRQINTKKIMDLNSAYLATQAQRIAAETKLRELTRISHERGGAQSLSAVTSAPMLEKLRSEAADLEVQRSRLLRTYKEKHPEVVKIDAQLALVHEKYAAEVNNMLRGIQAEYDVARAREESLLRQVNQFKQEAQDLNRKEIEYLDLQREADSTQQLYEAMLKRLKETGVTGGLETNNVRVVEEAQVPGAPIWPSKSKNLLLSIVFGLAAGVGIALALDYLDTTVKSPEDVERHLGLPVVGIIPSFGGKH
jgi:succinoglycan biosynthesis transport protein ExoP